MRAVFSPRLSWRCCETLQAARGERWTDRDRLSVVARVQRPAGALRERSGRASPRWTCRCRAAARRRAQIDALKAGPARRRVRAGAARGARPRIARCSARAARRLALPTDHPGRVARACPARSSPPRSRSCASPGRAVRRSSITWMRPRHAPGSPPADRARSAQQLDLVSLGRRRFRRGHRARRRSVISVARGRVPVDRGGRRRPTSASPGRRRPLRPSCASSSRSFAASAFAALEPAPAERAVARTWP